MALLLFPYARLPEFVLGCLIAQLYLVRKDRPVTAFERRTAEIALWLSFVVLALMGAFHATSFTNTAREYFEFLAQNFLTAIPIATVIYCVPGYQARCPGTGGCSARCTRRDQLLDLCCPHMDPSHFHPRACRVHHRLGRGRGLSHRFWNPTDACLGERDLSGHRASRPEMVERRYVKASPDPLRKQVGEQFAHIQAIVSAPRNCIGISCAACGCLLHLSGHYWSINGHEYRNVIDANEIALAVDSAQYFTPSRAVMLLGQLRRPAAELAVDNEIEFSRRPSRLKIWFDGEQSAQLSFPSAGGPPAVAIRRAYRRTCLIYETKRLPYVPRRNSLRRYSGRWVRLLRGCHAGVLRAFINLEFAVPSRARRSRRRRAPTCTRTW